MSFERIKEYGTDINDIRTKSYPFPFFYNISNDLKSATETINVENYFEKSEFNMLKSNLIDNLTDLISEGTLVFFAKTEKHTILRVNGTSKKLAYPNLKDENTKKKKEKKVKEKETYILLNEDIEERAKKVLEASKLNNKEGVIDIFEMISVPFNGENYKRSVFEKIFELAQIEGEYVDRLGYIVHSKERTKKTVVSHMDLIPLFNRDFKTNKVYDIEGNKLIGALDNTFTNAVVINYILNCDQKNIQDTTFLFTKDEETKQYAIRDYIKMYGNETFVCNLDVTNEGTKKTKDGKSWKYNMSVEYDEPSYHICKQIAENMENPFFTTERECDDLDEVMEADGFGLSYCLPTKGKIHSYDNYTLMEIIEPYMNGLKYIIENLCIKEKDCNIEHLDIKKAIKFKTFEKMKKKDIRKVRKTTSWKGKDPWDTRTSEPESEYEWIDTDDETGGQTYFDFGSGIASEETDPETCTRMSNLIMDIQAVYNPENYYDFEEFIGEKLFSNDSFTKGSFYLISSADAFNMMRKLNVVLPVNDDEFYFNQEIVDSTRFKIYEFLSKTKNISAYDFLSEKLIGTETFTFDDLKDCSEELEAYDIAETLKAMLTQGYIENEKGVFKIID